MEHTFEKKTIARGPERSLLRLPLSGEIREDMHPRPHWQFHIKRLGNRPILAFLSVEENVIRLRWRNHRDRIIKRLCSGRVFVLALEVHGLDIERVFVGHRGAETIDLSINGNLHENPHPVL